MEKSEESPQAVYKLRLQLVPLKPQCQLLSDYDLCSFFDFSNPSIRTKFGIVLRTQSKISRLFVGLIPQGKKRFQTARHFAQHINHAAAPSNCNRIGIFNSGGYWLRVYFYLLAS